MATTYFADKDEKEKNGKKKKKMMTEDFVVWDVGKFLVGFFEVGNS